MNADLIERQKTDEDKENIKPSVVIYLYTEGLKESKVKPKHIIISFINNKISHVME